MDQPNTKEQTEEAHSFKFCFNSEREPFAVVCNSPTSMTVLEALNTNTSFTKKNESSQEEIIIQRPDRAALNTDFPCCLIEKDEILTITFIKNEKKDFKGQQTHKAFSHRRTELVTFNIKTTGGKKVMYIMKSNALRKTADYVCVYALKREEVKTALKRDGRFIDKIFNEHYVLSENNVLGNQTKYEMSHPVEHLDKKTFQIIFNSHNPPDSKLKKQTEVKNESNVASNPSVSAKNDPDQNPTSTDQKETLHNKESTSLSTKRLVIPHSTEILNILRDQFKYLLETLEQRVKLNYPQVQKFFRAEYDKSVQSFSEVYKIKQLMRLSDSVCQIRAEGFAKGTGFLLFGRFVLTNAHVVRDFLESLDKLSSAKHLEAAFDFECLDSKVKLVPFKKQLAAYCFITDANNSRLDFALLELDDVDEITGRPGLLSRYIPGPPRNCGGICIVGHPDSGIKRMDPCFIIENLQEAADEHVFENVEFIQVMTQKSLEDKWGIYENQITYDSCFFNGSSGSPVFDEDCNLIGVHTGGYVYPGKKGKNRSIMEYAYSIPPILDMIRAQARLKGLHEVVNTLETHSNESGTAE